MNCIMADEAAKMTPFERACWNWYQENVNGFTLEAGIVADDYRRLRLKKIARTLFGQAMCLIHQSMIYVNRARAEQ